MAWGVTTLSAAQIARTQLDKPIIAAEQVLRDGIVAAKWVQSSEGWADADRSAAGYELTRLGAGMPSLISYPTLTGPTVTTVNAIFSLDSVAFDVIGLFNLAPIAFNQTVTVEIADDSAFSTNARVIAQWTNVQPRRLADFNLRHHTGGAFPDFQRYSAVDWMRITWTSASNLFGSGIRLGELHLGRRRQMWVKSDVGQFDDFEMDGLSSSFEAHGGDRWKYQAFGGRGVRRLAFRPHGGEDIDQVSELREMWRECGYGRRPVMYCERPSTVPNRAMMMSWEGDGFALPIEEYRNRTFSGVLMEQSPFLAEELTSI